VELATIRLKEMKVTALYLAGRYDETCPRATRLCHDALPGDLRKQFTPAHLRRVTQIVTTLKIQGQGGAQRLLQLRQLKVMPTLRRDRR
jgi:hypothetical protein